MKILRKKMPKNYSKQPIFKDKNSLLESWNDFMELKDRELNNREEMDKKWYG